MHAFRKWKTSIFGFIMTRMIQESRKHTKNPYTPAVLCGQQIK